MSVIIPSGAADANGILNAILGMFYSQGYSNVSGGTRSQVAIGNNYASLIVHKSPTPAPSKSSSSYSAWASTPTPTGNQVVAVFQAFIPGKAGATGNLSSLFTAGDQVSLGCGGGYFVAVEATSGKVARSTDGVNWTVTGAFATGHKYFRRIAWTGSVFVLVEVYSFVTYIWTSADGLSWTSRLAPAGQASASPTSNGSGVVVVPYNNTHPGTFAVSADHGGTWSKLTAQQWFGSAVWLGSQFYTQTLTGYFDAAMGGGSICTDGNSWGLAKPLPNGGMWESIRLAGYGSAVLAFSDGLHTGWGNASAATVAVSQDYGSTWSLVTLPATAQDASSAFEPVPVAYGAGVFVVVNSTISTATNIVMVSADNGNTWTQGALPTSAVWTSLTWNGSQFVLVAMNGVCYQSTDGITWASGSAALPAVHITQADVDAFNASLPTGAPYFYIVGSAEDPNLNPSGSSSFTTSPFNVLVQGSLLELTAPPTSYCVRGSFREVTAPPLPFTSNGSLVERVSSITLPLTDLGTGGALQHLGTPFKTVGG